MVSRRQITDVTYEKLPIDVTVLLDVSASVTGSALDELRRALRQLRTDLGARDRLRLVTFNMRVRRLVDFTVRRRPPTPRSRGSAAGGSSAVFDSLAVALTAADAAGPPAADRALQRRPGQQQHQRRGHAARRRAAQHAPPSRSSWPRRPGSARRRSSATSSKLASATISALADQIAGDTGGFVITLSSGDNLTSTFRRVLEQFRTTYVLYFTPQGVERRGSHTLDVRVKRERVEVRARRGYVWQ